MNQVPECNPKKFRNILTLKYGMIDPRNSAPPPHIDSALRRSPPWWWWQGGGQEDPTCALPHRDHADNVFEC